MKALILAAGYGTRLARDLASCEESYPLLVGVPKPLLSVSGHPLISHWIHMLKSAPEVTGIYVVVNAKYYDQFEVWSEYFPQVKLVCDGTTSNDGRLGAIACIQLAIKHFNIQDDIIVIGGDTLFFEDFSLSAMISKFFQSSSQREEGALVSVYNCKDEETIKFGIVEIDDLGHIISFLEKPLPSNTHSRLACPCFYIFSQGSLKVLDQFLEDRKDSPLKERDAPGHFVKYLSERKSVYTIEVKGRFDVGGLQSYLNCCRFYKSQLAKE